MKKIALTLSAATLVCITVSAQMTTMTSKNGHEVLPQEGDYSISMDAVPLVNMALNAFDIMNDNGNNAVHPSYVTGFDQTIVGKRFNSATSANRVRISIAHSDSTMRMFTPTFDDQGNVTGENEDVAKSRSTDILIGYGNEFRRGHNRLQGLYGYEGMLAFGSSSTKNKYGSDLAVGQTRELSSKDGASFGIGARGFVGAEYFFAPKMSIGAEFGWSLGISKTGRGKVENETNTNGTIETEETEGGMSQGNWGFEVDNGGGATILGGGTAALTLNLHF